MTRDVTLHVDEFGRHALERFARRSDGSMATAVRMASVYYLNDRDSRRPSWEVPRLALDSEPSGRLQVELDDATWGALSEEADRQGVRTDLLAMHALLYFLADIDSGRVTALLEDALENTDDGDFPR
jgi:hypothetical protein